MKEIVEQVLKEEENARLALEQARSQAERIVADAQEQASRLLADAATQTQSTVESRIAGAQAEYLAEKEKTLAAVKEQTQALRKAREKDITEISRGVFAQIISIED